MKKLLMLSSAGISLSVVGAVGLSMAHTSIVDPGLYRDSIAALSPETRVNIGPTDETSKAPPSGDIYTSDPVYSVAPAEDKGGTDTVVVETPTPVEPEVPDSVRELVVVPGVVIDPTRPVGRDDDNDRPRVATVRRPAASTVPQPVRTPRPAPVVTVVQAPSTPAQGSQDVGNIWVLGVYR